MKIICVMPSPVTHNPAKYPALAPPPRCLCAVYAASPVQAPAHIVSEEQLIFLYLLPPLGTEKIGSWK